MLQLKSNTIQLNCQPAIHIVYQLKPKSLWAESHMIYPLLATIAYCGHFLSSRKCPLFHWYIFLPLNYFYFQQQSFFYSSITITTITIIHQREEILVFLGHPITTVMHNIASRIWRKNIKVECKARQTLYVTKNCCRSYFIKNKK